MTFGQDAILNSLTLQRLTVSQGITTGSLSVVAGATIGGNLKVVGSITAQNVAATNALTALNGTMTNLHVTGNLIVDGLTIAPSGASVVEALYIFAGSTSVPISGFQGYNLDVSGSAIFRGGLTMGGPLAASNFVTIKGSSAQILFEDALGNTVGAVQGFTSGMYIESNQAVKFSNLNESAGDLLTIDPVAPAVTVGAGVTLNVRGIGGVGVTVSAPTVFTGAVTANSVVTAGQTLQVNGFIDARGGIKNTQVGGFLNLDDSVAISGTNLNVAQRIQQGDATGPGGLVLQIQGNTGPVAIGNPYASVSVLGPLVTAGLNGTTATFSGGVTSSTFVSARAMNISINNSSMPTSGLFVGQGIPASVGAPYTMPDSNGSVLTWDSVRLINNGTTTENGNLEVVVGSGLGSGNFRMYNTIGNGTTAYQNTLTLTRTGSLSVLGDLTIGGSATIPGNLLVTGGLTGSTANFSGLVTGYGGLTATTGFFNSGLTVGGSFSANNGAYVGGSFGLQIGDIVGGSLIAPSGGNGAAIGWNSVNPGAGNMELIIGEGAVSNGGGLNIWNTTGPAGNTANAKIFGLDRVGNLTLAGGITASAGNFGSGMVQTTGAVNTGTLVATGGIDARGGISNSTGTLVLNDNVSVSGSISANVIQNNYSSTILGPSYAWQYFWTGSYNNGQALTPISAWTDNYSSPQSYGLYTPPFGSVTTGYLVPSNGIYVLTLFVRTSDNAGTVGFRFCYSDATPIPSNGDSTLWIPRDGLNRQSASYSIVTKLAVPGVVTVSLEGGGNGSGDIVGCWFSGYMVAQL